MRTLLNIIRLTRPQHWSKNVFVLMPVPFALAAGSHFAAVDFLIGLLGISLTSSAVYAFNDAQDAELDRAHPKKKSRPVAAGEVSAGLARALAMALLAAGLALTWLGAGRSGLILVIVYATLNILYSVRAKQIALVDVFILSSGFVLRVLLGCALVRATPSSWLLLCTSGLALFLSLTKRRADLAMGLDPAHRPSLAGYSVGFLDHAISISAGMTLIAYALYCKEAQVLVHGREFASLPFVVFGVLEYLRQAHLQGSGGEPVSGVFSSPVLIACGAGWSAAIIWSLGIL